MNYIKSFIQILKQSVFEKKDKQLSKKKIHDQEFILRKDIESELESELEKNRTYNKEEEITLLLKEKLKKERKERLRKYREIK